jgi:hypothetical protein
MPYSTNRPDEAKIPRKLKDGQNQNKKHYRILTVNLQSQKDVLLTLAELQDGEKPSPDSSSKIDPAHERVIALLAGAKCKTIVAEEHVIDPDHRAAYARFFYLSHHNNPKFCKRLHFFATKLSDVDLAHLDSSHTDAYLGFITVRPLPSNQLGFSVFSQRFADALFPKNPPFLTCSTHFTINLFGNAIAIKGCPWMQQDQIVSRCATAALWMVSWYMAHKFAPEYRCYLTSEITDLAANHLMRERSVPSRGLSIHQMIHALKLMGYDPEYFESDDVRDVHRTVYRYVESGLPVILCIEFPELGRHAITLIGHVRNDPLLRQSAPTNGSLRFISDEISGFIAQDDSGGPFRLVDFEQRAKPRKIKKKPARRASTKASLSDVAPNSECLVVVDRGNDFKETGVLLGIVVPLPAEVGLSASTAAEAAQSLFDEFIASRFNVPNQLSTRTFLLRSDRLKCWLKEESGMPERIIDKLCQVSMSRWVWFTEISRKDSTTKERGVGCIIQDPASHPTKTSLRNLLGLQLGQVLITTDPDLNVDIMAIDDYLPHNIFTGVR